MMPDKGTYSVPTWLVLVHSLHHDMRTTNYPTHLDWRIRIDGMEHGEPHVYVEFRDGHRVSVSNVSRRVLAGGVAPARRLLPALEDIKINEAQYLAEYRRLNP